jgi:tRNA A37 threonylcarbamoyladenosine synthetase subunit TsaC/SUA5/YrdC
LKTELLDATKDHDNAYQQAIARAADLLLSGQLVAFPTDTVYGVAAVGSLPSAVARLYVAKGRPPDKAVPMSSIRSSRRSVIWCANWSISSGRAG